MTVNGYITEVFGSFQGEGPFVGERHVFVRFARCSLGCAYCDTPASREAVPEARLEDGPGGGETLLPNPVGLDAVVRSVLAQEAFPGFNAALSITGGEPLEQPEFVRALLEALVGRFRVVIETNGLHAEPLEGLRRLVDVVSMDVKLPSVSGLGPLWEEHARFLKACDGVVLVAKAVVSDATPPEEVSRAAGLVKELRPDAAFVIQPLTEPGGRPGVDGTKLLELYSAARGLLKDVRVIPQVHRILGVR